MSHLVSASLVLNVAVLVPVVAGILRDAAWAREVFGPRHPGRQILLAVYLAILIASVALLVHPEPRVASALLGVQVVYKVLSPLTTGTLKNPVVLSNLAIAVVHGVTLATVVHGG